ncbi:MAG: hypothetical protein OXI41_14860 [Chloroflexota bacterium]|nr:hypothetical protein [Chloroflexota bacterium]MDE2895849.1 hypothetical protein [Chloroflexota bacterium]
MTGIRLACFVASHVRLPDRWVYLLLTVALLAAVSALALVAGGDVEASVQPVNQEDVVPYGFQSFTEANGSTDPYAPFYGEGDMIEQTGPSFEHLPVNGGASGACIVPIYCH